MSKSVKDFRLSSLEDPTDEQLDELIRQVKESSIESSKKAELAKEKYFQELADDIKRDRL